MSQKQLKKQSRTQRRSKPAKIIIQKRDLDIIEAVHIANGISQSQLKRLFFGSYSKAQRRLKSLRDAKYLEREFPPILGGGRASALYKSTQAGLELLLCDEARGYDAQILESLKAKRRPLKLGMFTPHTMAVKEFQVIVTLACRQLGYKLAEWIGERELKADYDYVKITTGLGKTKSLSLIPDSYFVITITRDGVEKPYVFFLELDRGTMTSGKRFGSKIKAYNAYAQSGAFKKRYGYKSFRMLTVTESQGRLEYLKQVTEKLGGKNRFWFANLSDLTPKNIFSEPVWLAAGKTERSTLIISPAQVRQPRKKRLFSWRVLKPASFNIIPGS